MDLDRSSRADGSPPNRAQVIQSADVRSRRSDLQYQL